MAEEQQLCECDCDSGSDSLGKGSDMCGCVLGVGVSVHGEKKRRMDDAQTARRQARKKRVDGKDVMHETLQGCW